MAQILLILYPVNKGTQAKVSRLNVVNNDEIEEIWPININMSISILPKIKLKQVTTSPPNLLVLFFPKTPYKANVIAARSVKVTPIGDSLIDKGFIIIIIPITSKMRDIMLWE